nr:MAG TPA: hypothetical protein [Caudoviricetes sp.]
MLNPNLFSLFVKLTTIVTNHITSLSYIFIFYNSIIHPKGAFVNFNISNVVVS